MSRLPAKLLFLAAAGLLTISGNLWARSSDRSQPMNIDADWSGCNLGENMDCTFRGDIQITQGTLRITAAQGQLNQSGGRPSRAQLSGGVRMSQQMDDGSQVTTQSNSVDYNFNTEIIVLTGNVRITQPRGNLRGERVVYNMRTGEVQSGGEGGGRVRMTIQPRNAE